MMETKITKAHRGNSVIKNTFALNIRVVFIAFINLLTTRLVLAKLGVVDYGIFAVTAGFTGMLAFVNSALATSTQRHISYSLGAGNNDDACKWFNIGMFFHFAFAVILLILASTVGFLAFKHFLSIPPIRQHTAYLLYFATVITTVFSIVNVPFQALFNAYEQMTFVAFLSILQYSLTLCVALLLYVLPFDSLLLYGFGISSVAAIITILNWLIAKSNFSICKLNLSVLNDRSALREMGNYSGWNLFGAGAAIARVHGITILLNIFFGPVANAAFSVASQIAAQISFLSHSLIRAINPQIVKSEGARNRKRMVYLTNISCKYSFFLLSLIAVPLLLETQSMLKFWLKSIPENAVRFSQLMIIAALIEQLTVGIMTAVQAIGKVALYQIVVGSILILNIAIGYILFSLGAQPHSILIASIFINFIAGIFRLIFMIRLSGMDFREWVNNVMYRTTIWLIVPFIIGVSCIVGFHPTKWRLILTTISYVISAIVSFYILAIEKKDRQRIIEQGKALFEKFTVSKGKL